MLPNSQMDNEEIKSEADQLIQECHFAELLATYPQWFGGGR